MENYTEERPQLRWFLIRSFIITLVAVGIAERLVMTLVNQLIIPIIQTYLFQNKGEIPSLTSGEILMIVGSILLYLVLMGLRFVFPANIATGLDFLGLQLEKVINDLIPALEDDRTINQLRPDQSALLTILILAIIVLIAIPYVLAALYYSWVVSKQMEKIKEHEKTLHREYDKRRNLMLSDIAHDLRTPITTINGYAKAIQDHVVEDPEKQQEYLEAIQSKSLRMSELINWLFEYVKLDSEGFSLDKKPLDLIELVRENAAFLYGDLEEAGMELEVELPELEYPVMADHLQLSRVVTNLLNNAKKHNDPGTRILVTAQKTEDHFRIIVADSGNQIPPEVMEKLFEPFAMGDESRNSRGGSGLGLSIASKIVKMHGWKLLLWTDYPGYTKAFVIQVKS